MYPWPPKEETVLVEPWEPYLFHHLLKATFPSFLALFYVKKYNRILACNNTRLEGEKNIPVLKASAKLSKALPR
jgi:hypothetical protein